MATRKAPTGPKHDRCIGHVEHPYPTKGLLCVGAVIGEAGMIAFADHLASVRAEHRAAFLVAPEPAPSWFVNPDANPRDRQLVPMGDYRGMDVIPHVCTGNGNDGGCHAFSVHAHGGFASVPAIRNDTGLAELVARFRAMRGMPAETVSAPAPVRKARAVKVAPVVAETPAPVAEPSRCVQYLHTTGGMRRCMVEPDMHDGPHDYDRIIRPMMGEPYQMAPEPDTYAAAVELAETRPDPCDACGHPAHGATCATCDDAAQVGTYAPCAVPAHWPMPVENAMRITQALREIPRDDARVAAAVAAVQAPVEPIAEPAPVLSAPAPVSAPAERPTCPRCGQTFRVKGSGLAWHVANRPDCARVAAAV